MSWKKNLKAKLKKAKKHANYLGKVQMGMEAEFQDMLNNPFGKKKGKSNDLFQGFSELTKK